jgi:hypothetical protein
MEFAPSAAELVIPPTRRPRARTRGVGRLVVVVVLGGVGIGLAIWGGMWLRYLQRQEEQQKSASNAVEMYNCRFILPPPPWKVDDSVKRRLHVNVGLSRQGSEAHLGLFFRDYESRMPSEAELIEQALAKVRGYLGTVEWERKERAGAQLGGQPAVVLEFVGPDPDGTMVNGECYTLAHRGYGYWLFTWGPEESKEVLAGEWEKLRQNFHLLGGREHWQEKGRETEYLDGKKANYRLTYAKDLWKPKRAEDFDPRADAVLEAYEPDRENKPHAGKAAHFLVVLLPAAADTKAAVAAGRAYLEKHLAAENIEKPVISVVKEKQGVEADCDLNLGALAGHLTKLQVTVEDTDSYNRFMMLAVARQPEGLLMFLGDCDWNRRDFWEQEFLPLLQSLRTR